MRTLGFRTTLVLLVVFVSLAGLPEPGHAQRWYKRENLTEEAAAKIWFEEIVPYIITDEERGTFESLTTSEQRVRFIEQFWRRRDPDPRTPENEFLNEHIKRVVYANRLFGAGRPGWRTDRGRIYILLGPPNSVESSPAGFLPHQHPTEVWTYFNPPHPRLPPKLEFAFVDDDFDGEYQLTFDLLGDADATRRTEAVIGEGFFDAQTQAEILAMNLGRGGIHRSRLYGPNPQLERLHELSLVEQLPELQLGPLQPEVTASVTFTDLFEGAARSGIDHRVDFYKTSDGHVYLPVTLNLAYGEFAARPIGDQVETSFNVMAQLLNPKGEIEDAYFRREYFRISEQQRENLLQEKFLYELILYAQPGDYHLQVVVQDTIGNRVTSLEKDVFVPSFQGGLTLSSVTVADEIVTLEESERRGIKEPFTFGQYKVLPNFSRMFGVDETLDIYFEAYNLALDVEWTNSLRIALDAEWTNSLRIDYLLRRSGRLYRKVPSVYPHPGPLDEMTLVSSIPLTGFEPGDYSLTITVTDLISEQETSTVVEFRIR